MQTTRPVKDPRKQRKQLFNAPAHIRHKLMAAPLAAELVRSRGVKSLPVRKGDTVQVMRGDHKGFEGKISRIDLKHFRVFVEGLTREKVDGTTVFVSLHPSKVVIKNLGLDDKWRKETLERKKQLAKKEEEVVKKPQEKPARVKAEKPAEEKAAVEKKPAKPAKKTEVAKKAVEKKPAAKKPKEEKPEVPEAKPAKKEKKTKAPAKKAPAKRKAAAEKEGGA